MRALTLWPEWAFCVLYLGKRVENRSRPLPAGLVGEPIALHAGVRQVLRSGPSGQLPRTGRRLLELYHAERTAEAALRKVGTDPLDWPLEAPPWSRPHWRAMDALRGHIVGVVTFGPSRPAEYGSELEDSYVFASPGLHWWPITSVRVLDRPVRAEGALGFWRVSEDGERRVREQLQDG